LRFDIVGLPAGGNPVTLHNFASLPPIPHLLRSLRMAALTGVALAAIGVSSEALAQTMRPGLSDNGSGATRGSANSPAAQKPLYFDPTQIAPGIGVTLAPELLPPGVTPSGVTSKAAPPRAAKTTRRTTRNGTKTASKPFANAVGTLPPPPPELVPARRRRPPATDPYQSNGVRVGNLVLRPSIEIVGGYEDNPERRSTGKVPGTGIKGSALVRTDAALDLQSDWSRHNLTAKLRGGYVSYFDAPDASRPDATGVANLRLEASRDTTFETETRFRLDSQRPGSTELNAAVTGRPLTYAYGATVGGTHNINRLGLTLRGTVDRTTYDDGQLSNGNKIALSDRNVTQYGVRPRVSYEVSPGIKPFVEGLVDTRQFDQATDATGFRRNSNGLGGRVGTTVELNRQLVGEVAVGYQTRTFEDNRLQDLRGVIGEASLVWSATELTTVNLKGSVELADTTLPNVSGASSRKAEVQVIHALRRNLSVTGYASFAQTAYDGISLSEDVTVVGARLDYKLTPTMAVTTSFTHERFKSTTPGSDYTANIALVGLRFQL
jgi:hypothetical protein